MGNAVSQQPANRQKKKAAPKARWTYDYKNGRVVAVHAVPQAVPSRPLFLKRPSNNYNLLIAGHKRR